MRAVKGSSFVLQSPTFVAADEESPANTDGDDVMPVCTITGADGTEFDDAVVTQANPTALGVYQAQITTEHTADLDRLSVVWTAEVDEQEQVYRDEIEIVGRHYASVYEIRQGDGLSVTTSPTAAEIKSVRDQYESKVEEICGQAFVPRFERETIRGTGSGTLVLKWLHPRTVRSISFGGVAQTVADFECQPHGVIVTSGRFPCSSTPNVIVEYEHGADAPREDLRREVLKAIRAELNASKAGGSAQVISATFDGQTFRYSTPDPKNGRPTGIKDLDPVLVDIGVRPPGIG